MSPSLTYRLVKFEHQINEYGDLKTFRYHFTDDDADWYYLGPVAVTSESAEDDQKGLIVKANDSSALDEVADWEQVFKDQETGRFSTWRGIPRNPDDYVVIGHFFTVGNVKPSAEDTARIRAVRKDLIAEREPNHLIVALRLPWALLTLWKKTFSDLLHVPTGAFVSKDGDGAVGLLIGLLIHGATQVEAAACK